MKRYWKIREILDGREFATGEVGNPFLHISFHKMVEDQLEAGRPEEVLSFLESMTAKGFARHDIVHVVMKILIRLIAEAMNRQKPLDIRRYRRILKNCRNIGLDDVPDVLDREFTAH